MDASKKIFGATEILVFDFELFIGELGQKMKELTTILSCELFDDIGRYFFAGFVAGYGLTTRL
jgi:hypothetical protein